MNIRKSLTPIRYSAKLLKNPRFRRTSPGAVISISIFSLILITTSIIFSNLSLFKWIYRCKVTKGLENDKSCTEDINLLSSPIRAYLWQLFLPSGYFKYTSLNTILTKFYKNQKEPVRSSRFISLDDQPVTPVRNPDDEVTNSSYTIPRVIHQLYPNSSLEGIDPDWEEAHYTVKHFHNVGYDHILWSDETMRQFIANHYPNFLPTYDSYPVKIQRVDAFRYFALYHYGGFYVDFDIGARQSFEPLVNIGNCGAILAETKPFGISNDFMAFRKNHPLMKRVIEVLPTWNQWYLSPYASVMLSTGPTFLTAHLKILGFMNPSAVEDVRILEPDAYQLDEGFLWHVTGSSWHSSDAKVFLAIGDNLFSIISLIILSIILLSLRALGFFKWLGKYYRVTLVINEKHFKIL